MLPYTGNGAYCYANSLHMMLHSTDHPALPTAGQLECLTTMPFGFMALRLGDDVMFFPNNPETEPDAGLTRAISYLGWACDEWHGGTPDEAVAHLRDALNHSPVLIGPVDMGGLTYIPWREDAVGSDHYVAALGIEGDSVQVHDPAGWPFALISLDALIEAWKAEKIGYGRKLLMRFNFRPDHPRSISEAAAQALPAIRSGIKAVFEGPSHYGGAAALSLAISELRAGRDPGGMAYFPLPLGARRSLDGALFLREAGLDEAAGLMAQIAILYGKAQQPAVDKRWDEVADVLEAICEVHQRLVQAV